ncbi:oligosaccharide flippase family protein [uncultured Prochlorococcus sp.]|uniref:oligosaccharide flippase family protein n=1 Tax=uncultured Prochlorococcus sp. TaxID=159733 RepID=UPI00258C9F31|nr:oligosaccharide flippase family protein [uncultured Prochlorococcus sp.]
MNILFKTVYLKNKIIQNIKSEKIFVFNTLSLGSIYGINFLISLITLPHLLKVYGLSVWGNIVFIQLIFNYLIWLTDWSFNIYSSKFVSINFQNQDTLKKIFRETWTAQLLLTIFSLFLSFLYNHFFYHSVQLSFYFALILLGKFLQPYWFLNGIEKIYETALFQLINKVIFAIFIIFFINKGSNINTYFLYYGISFFIVGIACITRINFISKGLIGFSKIKKSIIALKKSFKLFLSLILGNFINSSIQFLIGIFLDPVNLGIYNVADRIKGFSSQLNQPLTNSIFPKIVKEYNKDKKLGNKFLVFNLKILVPLTLFLFLIINLNLTFIVNYFSKENIQEIIIILRIILFSFVFNVVEEIIVNQYMVTNGIYSSINKLKILKLILVFVFGIPLVFYYGIIGAAFTSLISELFAFFFVIFKYNKTKKIIFKEEEF